MSKKLVARVKLYPHQYEFINSDHPFTVLLGGYGSGKTFTVIRKIFECLQRRNRELVAHPYVVYGAPTYDLVNTIWYPDFIQFLEEMQIRYDEEKKNRSIYIKEPGLKGTVKYLTLNNPERIIGFNATDILYDEFEILPIKKQDIAWKNGLARLRGCENGTLSIATTPEGHKKIYQLHNDGKIHLIRASTTDNKTLPQSYIDELFNNYDDLHQQMYINGEFVNLAGTKAIYQFKREDLLPAVDPSEIPDDLTVGMDFNVDPFCSTISGFFSGVKLTFDEFYLRNLGGTGGYESYTDKTCHHILDKYPNHYWWANKLNQDIKRRYHSIKVRPDMTGGARKTSAGITDIDILRRYGFEVEGSRSNPYVPDRLKICNVAMAKGIWKITDNCKELIKDLESVIVDEHGEIVKGDNMRTHLLDAATYDAYRCFYQLFDSNKPKITARSV